MNKLTRTNKKNKQPKCNKYKSCNHVPCNSTMNECTPSYCVPGSSRNWGYCNMANWGPGYEKYKKMCKSERYCKLVKTKKTKNTVDALTLHNKMPYIWRFLKPKTRKYMIELANKKVKKINIPFHIFPDLKINNRENLYKITKNMTKKNRQKKIDKNLFSLRKKYKNI